MQLDVNFKETTDASKAPFTLAYAGDNGDALAEAFFLDTKKSNCMSVNSRAFQLAVKEYMINYSTTS